jgi:hypothetical protein
MRPRTRTLFATVAVLLLAGGCATATPDTPLSTSAGGTVAAGERPVVTVHRTESCSCCGSYEEHLEAAGFEVVVELHDDANVLQDELGVPEELRSCHVNVVDGYLAVGHVPVEALDDLVATRPDLTGIALAGMPLGSPGMPGEQEGPFVVEGFLDGAVTGLVGRY